MSGTRDLCHMATKPRWCRAAVIREWLVKELILMQWARVRTYGPTVEWNWIINSMVVRTMWRMLVPVEQNSFHRHAQEWVPTNAAMRITKRMISPIRWRTTVLTRWKRSETQCLERRQRQINSRRGKCTEKKKSSKSSSFRAIQGLIPFNWIKI